MKHPQWVSVWGVGGVGHTEEGEWMPAQDGGPAGDPVPALGI